MFSKEDYQVYFEQVAHVEREMIYELYDALQALTDVWCVEQLQSVADDEVRHYAYMKGIFDSAVFKGLKEKRSFEREHALGRVRLTHPGTGTVYHAYCADVSEGGMCLEFKDHIPEHEDLEVDVTFFDKRPAWHEKGSLVWNVTIPPHLRLGKIQFKAGFMFS